MNSMKEWTDAWSSMLLSARQVAMKRAAPGRTHRPPAFRKTLLPRIALELMIEQRMLGLRAWAGRTTLAQAVVLTFVGHRRGLVACERQACMR